jgi:hypothetical protein
LIVRFEEADRTHADLGVLVLGLRKRVTRYNASPASGLFVAPPVCLPALSACVALSSVCVGELRQEMERAA